MFGTIVRYDFCGNDVLAVVLEVSGEKWSGQYFHLARTKLEVNDQNIEKVKNFTFEEILNLNTSGCPESAIKSISLHPKAKEWESNIQQHAERYQPLRTAELADIVFKLEVNDLDIFHRKALLNVAENKGIFNIVHTALSKA